MVYLLIVLVGVCLGVLLATTRVPQSRVAPAIAILLLITMTIAVLMLVWPALLFSGIVLLVSLLVGNYVYGGILWKDVPPNQALSTRELIWQDFTGYLRRSYRGQKRERLSDTEEHTHIEAP